MEITRKALISRKLAALNQAVSSFKKFPNASNYLRLERAMLDYPDAKLNQDDMFPENTTDSDVQTSENGVQSQESVSTQDTSVKRYILNPGMQAGDSLYFDDMITACEQALMLYAESGDSSIYVIDTNADLIYTPEECEYNLSAFQDSEFRTIGCVRGFCDVVQGIDRQRALYARLGFPVDKCGEFGYLFIEVLSDFSIGRIYGVHSHLMSTGYPVLDLRLWYNWIPA